MVVKAEDLSPFYLFLLRSRVAILRAYWKNWFPQGESETTESTRLAYVAFSRAKQFLAIGIPTPTNSSLDDTDFRLIQNYGFKVYDCSTQSWIEK